jgi:hypothetical protein
MNPLILFNDNRAFCASPCFCNQDDGDLSRDWGIVGGTVSGLGDFKITERKTCPSSPKFPELLLGPLDLLFNQYRCSFPRVRRPVREFGHSNLLPKLRISGTTPLLSLCTFIW